MDPRSVSMHISSHRNRRRTFTPALVPAVIMWLLGKEGIVRAFSYSRLTSIRKAQGGSILLRTCTGSGGSGLFLKNSSSSSSSSSRRTRNINRILDGLNDSQRAAVTMPHNSLVRVVAGPGAGKTKVLTSRIAWLLNNDGTSPVRTMDTRREESSRTEFLPRILAVTFTKKAAGEMEQRLRMLLERMQATDEVPAYVRGNDDEVPEASLPKGMNRVTLGTFHSVCSRILRRYGDQLNRLPSVRCYKNSCLDSSFTILDQSEQIRVVKECMKRTGVATTTSSQQAADSSSTIKPGDILHHISNMKANDMDRSSYANEGLKPKNQSPKMKRLLNLSREIYPLYCSNLFARNALDFDDLLLLSRDLISSNSTVLSELQKRWSFVLIDEFQDTSNVQLDLVSKLVNKSLFIVGDQDQSIYSWRGASIEGMMNDRIFGSERKTAVHTLYLTENYRCTQNIVKAAQKVIMVNDFNEPSTSKSRRETKSMREAGTMPRILACADSDAEALKVVSTIQQMISEQKLIAERGDTAAILYRTNAQSRVIEEACVRENLRYLIRGNAGTFYSRREIQDCLCFIKLIYNGRDEASFNRAVKTPPRGIGPTTLSDFKSFCDSLPIEMSLTDAVLSLTNEDLSKRYNPDEKLSGRSLKALRKFSEDFRTIYDLKGVLKVGDLLQKVIDSQKLETHFKSVSKSNDEYNDRLANVDELKLAAGRYQTTDLTEFLDDVALLSDLGSEFGNEPKDTHKKIQANLMTIHAAKGMEFDAVFIVGNEDGTFPTQRAINEGHSSAELAEERRLLYVAMTRAKSYLCMSWRKSVDYFSGQGIATREGKRSRFLNILVGKKNDTKTKVGSEAPQVNRNRTTRLRKSNVTEVGQRKFSSHNNFNKAKLDKKSVIRSVDDLQQKLRSKVTHSGQRKSELRRKSDTRSSLQQPSYLGKSTRRLQKKSLSADEMEEIFSQVNSNMFYPVGSNVRHRIHGSGIVINPDDKASVDQVHVKFASGISLNFPISGGELQHIGSGT